MLVLLEVEDVKQKQEALVEQVVIEPQDWAVHWVEVQEPRWRDSQWVLVGGGRGRERGRAMFMFR